MAKKTESGEFQAFTAALSAGVPEKLYIFHGEEHYLMGRYLEQLRTLLVGDGLSEFNHRRFEGRGFSVAELADAVDMLPVFAERTLIEVHDFDLFSGDEDTRTLLVRLLSDLPDYVCLVFVYDTLVYKPDTRLKTTKEILAAAHVVEFALQEREKVVRWVRRHVRECGKNISLADAEYLTFLTGGQMTVLNTEIAKLCTFNDEETVSRQDIDACVTPAVEAVSYKLGEHLASGNFRQAAGVLEDLLQLREAPQKVLYAVSSSLRSLLYTKLLLEAGKGREFIRSALSVRFDYQLNLLTSSAQKLTADQCRRMVLSCSAAAMNANSGVSDREVLTGMFLELCAIRKEKKPC